MGLQMDLGVKQGPREKIKQGLQGYLRLSVGSPSRTTENDMVRLPEESF